jgi:hypothetical protein
MIGYRKHSMKKRREMARRLILQGGVVECKSCNNVEPMTENILVQTLSGEYVCRDCGGGDTRWLTADEIDRK